MKKFFLYAALILLIIIVAGGFLIYNDFNQHTTKSFKNYPGKIIVNIPKGKSVAEIGRILFVKGVISSYSYFRIYYKLKFSDIRLKSGEYVFDNALNMKEVIIKLSKGEFIPIKIRIKEGMTLEEIASDLIALYRFKLDDIKQVIYEGALVKDFDPAASDLEGYLLPETYHVNKSIKLKQFIEVVLDKFKERLSINLRMRIRDMGFNVREIITLASLIEKETSLESERKLVSSVFHNRLKRGMLLQCDPTMIYALKKQGIYNKMKWKKRGREIDSPYNTYKYKGLPPGPICNPSFASILAAIEPANSDYLYFVRKKRGEKAHHFSKSYKEHRWAIRKSQRGWD